MFIFQQGSGMGPMFTMGFRELIKNSFKNGSSVTKLIYINIAIYLATKVGLIFAFLFGIPKSEYFQALNSVLDLPGTIEGVMLAPWTVITYMFVHYGFLHLLFNMFLLFWFGRALKERSSNGVIIALYILGGLVGAVCYLFIAPKFGGTLTHLAGASASVMAIMATRCIWEWREPIQIFLLGSVKSLYVLLFLLGFELLQLSNPIGVGSAVVHLGGAVVGLLCGVVCLIFTKRMDSTGAEQEMHWEGNYETPHTSSKRDEEERVNRILDKVSESGYDSLTPEEKSILFKSGQR